MSTELRVLRQFVAVAEDLHFGRAAARLHMTQPPLTMAVQSLERDVGVTLFDRSRRAVTLTAAGQALLPEARRVLALAEDLPAVARAAAAGLSGRLRLAFVSSIAYGPLPGWLRGFRESYADVRLELREATLDVQLQAFDADEIDAGFALHAPDAAPAGFGASCVLREPMVVAMPEDHAAARSARSVRIGAVMNDPLVIFPRHIAPSLYDAVLSTYRAHGATPRIAQEAIQMQTIVNLVSAGMGVAWVPASMMRLQLPGVIYRSVTGSPLRCETSLLRKEPPTPVVERFVAHVLALRRQSDAAGRPAESSRRPVVGGALETAISLSTGVTKKSGKPTVR